MRSGSASTGSLLVTEANVRGTCAGLTSIGYREWFVNRRSMSRVLALGMGLFVALVPSASVVGTTPPPDEEYPPADVINLLDPFGCAPETISGDIGEVLVGSTVRLELILLGGTGGEELLAEVTVTPGPDGHAVYSIPVPPDRFGPVVVRATGTNTVNEPFVIETTGTIVDCPALPPTGSSGIGNWLRGGAALVLAGVAMLVMAMRRRRHAFGGAR